TQGNPFFLEESVRTLVETGVLVGDRGAYHLDKPLDTLQNPATVQALPMRSRGALRRGARWWRRRSAKVSAEAPSLPPRLYGSARSVVWRDTSMRPGGRAARRWTWPDSRRRAGTRRARCTSWTLSMPTPISLTLRRLKRTTTGLSPSPRS